MERGAVDESFVRRVLRGQTKRTGSDCERGSEPSGRPDLLIGPACGIQRLPLRQEAILAGKGFFFC